MGSVKNLIVKKEATVTQMGLGTFEFTDDYSVFDYGKMPDTIPAKGEALCRMAAYNFEQLQKLGISTHYVSCPAPNKMEVKLVRVLYPQKNQLKKGDANYLVPLEVIFRNSLPEGSSVFKRMKSGELDYKELGLDHIPKPGEKLEKPILDVSTKLEMTDRYMGWKEAQELACLSDKQLAELQNATLKIDDFITKRSGQIGLEHADGKVEFAITPEGKLMLIDVCGTLDENRMLYNGVHISKQVIRDYYKLTPWYSSLENAKAAGVQKGGYPLAPKMPNELKEIVSNMYKSVCEAWIGKKIWNAPEIKEVVEDYLSFVESLQVKEKAV